MCKFDCSSFLGKCHAACCGVVPFEKELYEKIKSKIVTPPIKELEFYDIDPFDNVKKDFVLPLTESSKCCFLQEDFKCAIYEDRPKVCQVYGDESYPSLSCAWQDKDGNARSRQAKRLIERKSRKNLESYLKKGKQNERVL